ncbi:RepB family DNA primase [Dehalococcoidia bacterium]|nr:RepB family DNA primase [Dehalococcoidia bacterium]
MTYGSGYFKKYLTKVATLMLESPRSDLMTSNPRIADSLLEPLQVAAALLESVSESGFFEVRVIPSEGPVAQRFFPVSVVRETNDWVHDIGQHDGRGNVYYGVIPRTQRRGTADACGPAQAAWADFDDGAPAAIPAAPSIVVETSPGKYQALWLLATPCAELQRVEAVNRSIAFRYGGDGNACDRARVLRLPGFRNVKYDAQPYARLVVFRPNHRLSIEGLEEAFPPPARPTVATTTARPHHSEAPTWLVYVFDAIVDFLECGGFSPRMVGERGVLARCPLHRDEHPSLSLHPVRGWKCWAGCGKGRLTLLAAKLRMRVPGDPR